MESVTNPRKKESIRKIGKSFIELLQYKSITDISVIDICKKANINRSTFYANFFDIYDLADNLKEKLEKEIFSLYENNEINIYSTDDYLRLFRNIKENKLLYKTYFKLGYANNFVVAKYDKKLAYKFFNDKNTKYHIEFFKCGLCSIIKMWLENDCKESPEEMAEVLRDEYSNKNCF